MVVRCYVHGFTNGYPDLNTYCRQLMVNQI